MAKTAIRKATNKDLDWILELWEEMDSSHKRYDTKYYRRISKRECEKQARKYYGSFLRKRGHFILVAEVDGEVQGCAACKTSMRPPVCAERKMGMIDMIVVDRAHRREGIGAQLMKAAAKEFKRQKTPVLFLMVDVDNKPAIGLYGVSGFKGRQQQMFKFL